MTASDCSEEPLSVSDYQMESDFDEQSEYDVEDWGEVSSSSRPDRGGSATVPGGVSAECLSIPEISTRMAEIASEVCELTGLSIDDAYICLRHFNWQKDRFTEAWFQDPDHTCKKVRILPGIWDEGSLGTTSCGSSGSDAPPDSPPLSKVLCPNSVLQCQICFDDVEEKFHKENFRVKQIEMPCLPCGHRFCKVCWGGLLKCEVGEGSSCLLTRCPDPKCQEKVRGGMFKALCDEQVYEKYEYYNKRSFVENNPNAKWCPAPDCPHCVLVKDGVPKPDIESQQSVDVQCKCQYRWCFLCTEEAHRPVSCQMLKKWNEKNQDEAENMTWILANTKPCPKCGNPIEKNQGCMHMSCRCGHQFCWLCLADDYNYSHTRDGRPCNKFLEKPDQEQEASRQNLARYAHFFERYRSHNHAQQVAMETTLPKFREDMEKLHRHIGAWTEITFLEDAIQQIINCRRMLKWTYVLKKKFSQKIFGYGYFAPFQKEQEDYFVYQQGMLEQKVDQLQQLAEEQDLDKYHDDGEGTHDTPSEEPSESSTPAPSTVRSSGSFGSNANKGIPPDFVEFKSKLNNLTMVVKNFFDAISGMFEDWERESKSNPSSARGDGSSLPSDGALMHGYPAAERNVDGSPLRQRQRLTATDNK